MTRFEVLFNEAGINNSEKLFLVELLVQISNGKNDILFLNLFIYFKINLVFKNYDKQKEFLNMLLSPYISKLLSFSKCFENISDFFHAVGVGRLTGVDDSAIISVCREFYEYFFVFHQF